MSLTNLQIQKAKPKEKQYKLSDGRGMYLIVAPRGGRYWRLDYRFNGKRQTLSLGTFPSTSLKEARRKCANTKSLIEDGIDPSHQRKIKLAGDKDSFEAVAKEWYGKYRSQWTDNHATTTLRRIEANLFPWLGSRPIAVIEPREILQTLRRIEKRGSLETAHRVQQIASRIFRYAVATGQCTRDPTTDLKGALPPTRSTHFPTITDPTEIGALLRTIDGYQGSPITQFALQMAPLVFVRPGELRHCEWVGLVFLAIEAVIGLAALGVTFGVGALVTGLIIIVWSPELTEGLINQLFTAALISVIAYFPIKRLQNRTGSSDINKY